MTRGRKVLSSLQIDDQLQQSAGSRWLSLEKVIKKYQKDAKAKDWQGYVFTEAKILKFLDTGSSGLVCVCKCDTPSPRHEKPCVLKLPLDTTPDCTKRVEKDMEFWKQCPGLMDNPFLVSPITEDTLFPPGLICMPKWDTSLSRILRSKAVIDGQQLVVLVKAMCQGSHALHQCTPPRIHRDIKPANILVNLQEKRITQAAITDFGSVQVMNNPDSDQSGTTVGYRAPEVVWNLTIKDQASDQWSIATIVLELMLGTTIFKYSADNPIVAENRHLFALALRHKEDIPDLLAMSTDTMGATTLSLMMNNWEMHGKLCTPWHKLEAMNAWDPDLICVLQRCFQLHPSKRFATVQDFQRAFTNVIYLTKTYSLSRQPLRCPSSTCKWEEIYDQKGSMSNIHIWFVAILWTNHPAQSVLISRWFKTNFITERAHRFQMAALQLWQGNVGWISAVTSLVSSSKPDSPEAFYKHFMKLPRPLLQDPESNTWKVGDITQSTFPGSSKMDVLFTSVSSSADMQLIVINAKRNGRLKEYWCSVAPCERPDLFVGHHVATHLQNSVFIHHTLLNMGQTPNQSTLLASVRRDRNHTAKIENNKS